MNSYPASVDGRIEVICPECNGDRGIEVRCPSCDGHGGWVEEEEEGQHATVRLRKREDVWPVTFALRNLRIPYNVGFTVEHDPTIIPDWELDGPDSIAVQFTAVLDVKVGQE